MVPLQETLQKTETNIKAKKKSRLVPRIFQTDIEIPCKIQELSQLFYGTQNAQFMNQSMLSGVKNAKQQQNTSKSKGAFQKKMDWLHQMLHKSNKYKFLTQGESEEEDDRDPIHNIIKRSKNQNQECSYSSTFSSRKKGAGNIQMELSPSLWSKRQRIFFSNERNQMLRKRKNQQNEKVQQDEIKLNFIQQCIISQKQSPTKFI